MRLTKREKMQRWRRAIKQAKKILKPGDRCRGRHGCGQRHAFIFAGWEGNWIVSKSGISDFSACSIYWLNGQKVDFTKGES